MPVQHERECAGDGRHQQIGRGSEAARATKATPSAKVAPLVGCCLERQARFPDTPGPVSVSSGTPDAGAGPPARASSSSRPMKGVEGTADARRSCCALRHLATVSRIWAKSVVISGAGSTPKLVPDHAAEALVVCQRGGTLATQPEQVHQLLVRLLVPGIELDQAPGRLLGCFVRPALFIDRRSGRPGQPSTCW